MHVVEPQGVDKAVDVGVGVAQPRHLRVEALADIVCPAAALQCPFEHVPTLYRVPGDDGF